MRIGFGSEPETHVDDESHIEIAQSVVIAEGRHIADEEVFGDFRKVHMGIVSQDRKWKVVGLQSVYRCMLESLNVEGR